MTSHPSRHLKESDSERGFTLLELSIVIAVIALIAGGIIAGDNLIQSSKLQSIMTQVEECRTQFNKFDEIYDALPGDFSNAEAQWGAATTNNGNGDRRISTWDTEGLMAWQHLQMANLIEGNFTGLVSRRKRGRA